MANVKRDQLDDYYWQGSRFSRGDNGTIYGMRASLAAAQALFNQKLG